MTASQAVWLENDAIDEESACEVGDTQPKIKSEEAYQDELAQAQRCIDEFFADKQMHCGGLVPKRFLHDPVRVRTVVDYSIIDGVTRCYAALENTNTKEEEEQAEAKRTGDSTDDIKLVSETLKLLARSRVPKRYAGGMLVMYLEWMEGVEF